MKLKKEIATLLLASTLLAAPLTACQQTPDGGDKIDNATLEITTVETTPQETTTPKPPNTNQNPFDFSLSELGGKLGCYVSQEYGNNLEVAMENDDAPFPIRFEYEEYKSTEFKMITQQGDAEFSITLPLKKPCRVLDWYSSFQDDLNGYVFVFDSNYASISAMPAIELVYLLKTTDGGKTWDVKQYQDPPSVGGRDYIEGAHFFTDQIGFFMARLWSFDDLVDRTYWTFDGGNTWELMSPIQYPDLKTALGADKYNYSTEIADLELIDDTYYMTVIIVADGPYSFDGDYFLCVKYASKDLKNWTLVTKYEEETDTKPARKAPTFHNGVWGNSNVTYTYNQNTELSVHIADWNEDHLVTSLSDLDVSAAKYSPSAIGVNNERAFLVLEQFYEPKITVVSFERGSQSETVVELDVDETMYEVEGYILSGTFISEKVGYLFVFTEVIGGHSRGSAKLSHFFKTEDGGNTWQSLNVQNIPLLDLRNHIIYAKMINENVGLISGAIFGADYDFCERTLLTTDGGLNWVHINIPELPQDDNLPWAEVTNFTQIGESYILTIRYTKSQENFTCTYDYAKYESVDLNTWTRIN